jgi:hypothetical protein
MAIASAVWDDEPPPASLASQKNSVPLALFMALRHQQSSPDAERNLDEEAAMRQILVKDHAVFCKHPHVRAVIKRNIH